MLGFLTNASKLLLSVPFVAAFILFSPLLGRNHGKPVTYTGPVFEDVALKKRRDRTAYVLPRQTLRHRIHECRSGLFDCDNDGKLDIVTVNGSTVERYREGGDPMVTLYHQQPDGTFTDIIKSAGLIRVS